MMTPCPCQRFPCVCEPRIRTQCDRYIPGTQNVWVEKGPNPEDQKCEGICLLDSMSEAQIIYSLERDEKARQDLLTVTSNPCLLHLARTVPRLPVVEETDAEQALINRPNEPAQNPFYAIFRGQPPFAQ